MIEPLTQEEVSLLLRACDQMEPYDRRWKRNVSAKRPTALRDRAILLALVDTGLRASELTALTMGDYEEKRGRLRVLHGKGDKERTVFLGDTSRLAVWRYLATREGLRPSSPLFATRGGAGLDRAGLLHLVQ
ncbi:tyrosine-type recombinase/integrase, partial [Arthrospira platensis SPKY1]|nr:tyrosine-type recombinase/integrase [Arthrospira platensis SPKY1]